jgi:hypothetical protein
MNPTEYQTLRQSPLFQLSLASKELFHSNFLAWLFDRHPTWVGPILGTQPGDERWALGPKGSRREERNLDLVLHLEEGITLIVENKVKSMPYRAQLDEYEKKVKALEVNYPSPRFLLLTLAAGDAPARSTWPVLTYGLVGERLLRTASGLEEGYERSLIEDYAGFIQVMSEVGEIRGDDPWIESDPVFRNLRISDLLQKRKATWLSRSLASNLNAGHGVKLAEVGTKAMDLELGQLLIYDGLTNGNGLVGFVLAVADGAKLTGARALPRIGIGVQVQGNQYRSYLELLRPVKPNSDTREDFHTLCLGLFDRSPLPAWWAPGESGRSRKDLCSYGGTFLYRYRELPESSPGHQATLESLAANLVASARAVIDGVSEVRAAIETP